MSACHVHASATIELYFYGELSFEECEAVAQHLSTCRECRLALEELRLIRTALDTRPVVDAPSGGDWSGFMARLDNAVDTRPKGLRPPPLFRVVPFHRRPRVAAALAMAALLALITIGALVALRQPGRAIPGTAAGTVAPVAHATPPQPSGMLAADPALASVSEQHLKRSQLVVLGLATRDPDAGAAADWDYERTLATSLLNDTRLYRQAAEARGMKALAGVMRDLELVLLQTSMSERPDSESLAQLQRLIRRRDLITKMEVVSTTGLLP